MKLDKQQLNAKSEILKWFKESEEKYMLLSGPAGTGKTTIVINICKELEEKGKRVVATGATNAVVSLLKKNLINIQTETIHTFLGLKVKKKQDETYLDKENVEIKKYDLVIVDECSMLDEVLWNEIINHSCKETKWLFIGDPCQLSPVKCEESRAFKVKEKICLNNIKRVEKKNPILILTNQLRENISTENFILPKIESNVNNKEGVILYNKSDISKWLSKVINFFISEKYENINSGRIILYRNITEQKFNRYVRNYINGETESEYVVNEEIILKKPSVYYGDNTLPTNSLVKISNVENIIIQPNKTYTYLPEYFVDGYRIEGVSDNKEVVLTLVSPCKVHEFDKWKKSCIKRFKRNNLNIWESWNEFVDSIDDASYKYATTVRRLQGTTLTYSFPVIGDLISCFGQYEKLRNLYSAFSRASKLAIALE